MTQPNQRVRRQPRLVAAGLVLGLALLGRAAVPGSGVQAQGAAAPAGLETIQIRPNVYVIFGAGSNITVHLGEDGVILVDAGTAALAPQVVTAVKALTSQPIRLIVNTSADADHVTGNEIVSAAGREVNPDAFSEDPHATVLAHENVMLRMSTPSGTDTLFPTALWPSETYTARVRSMYLNNEAVLVHRQVGAHSDGDSVVLFRKADVIATGDILDLRHFPVIDPAQGGSIQGELDALNRLLELTVPAMPLVLKPGRTLLVPGHGRVSDYAELVEYRDMVTTIKDNIAVLIKEGKTLAQIQAANPSAGYRARWGRETGPWTTAQFVEAIYNGLTAPAGK
jgi:glyoxylase-like metal-dependent hydrolase (beta-lactamase superfamily II)